MKHIMDLFRWPVEACIYLLDHESDIYTLKPERKRELMLEVGCSDVTLRRAIKAIKVRELLINSELGLSKLDKKLTDKNFILMCTIDRLKQYVLKLYRIIEEIKRTEEIPSFAGDMTIKAIDAVVERMTAPKKKVTE